MSAPSADVKETTVTQEFRKGFRVGGRLIRPAMVGVSTPADEDATPSGAAEAEEEGAADGAAAEGADE